jgi:hypothetical protein
MRKILVFLFLVFANQTLAFCPPEVVYCNPEDPLDDIFRNCVRKTPEQLALNKKPALNGKACSGDRLCADVAKMYDNCFLDKMRGRGKIEFGAVKRTCERIACHPTLVQKFKYR